MPSAITGSPYLAPHGGALNFISPLYIPPVDDIDFVEPEPLEIDCFDNDEVLGFRVLDRHTKSGGW